MSCDSKKNKLSVIMPVYNEAGTIKRTLDALIKKSIPGVDMEIILIESNSTDGTRNTILEYKGNSKLKLILQDKPRGKGNAVREGFKHIAGDFVLIQDGDLEYDLDDYDALLAPLISGQADFVLGSRHSGKTWKMRDFKDDKVNTLLLNSAHWLFCGLINLFFGLSLKDPFTMYKVFRSGCIKGLKFECNRFDFDWELLIKLVRKGYKPLEIPVTYNSRSFKEGKKVSIWRDPLTWIVALIKYRFVKI